MSGKKTTSETAVDLIACAQLWDDCVRLIGNVRADEIAELARDLLAAQARVKELTELEATIARAGDAQAEMESRRDTAHDDKASGAYDDCASILAEALAGDGGKARPTSAAASACLRLPST